MNELIKISISENQDQVLSARELHEKLGINQDFTNWFKYQSSKLNLVESVDYSLLNNISEQTGRGGHNKIDYHVTIDIAKHITMISGGEKAHELRNYFIQVERAWNSPEKIMARALEFARIELHTVRKQVEIMAPKALFADSVSTSKTSILIGELAKVLKQNGIDIGQNRLFEWLREKGYLIKRKGTDFNMPTQMSMELGLFEIKETVINHSDGHTSISKTAKITGKGQIYFTNKFLSNY